VLKDGMPENKNWKKEEASHGLMWNKGYNQALDDVDTKLKTLLLGGDVG